MAVSATPTTDSAAPASATEGRLLAALRQYWGYDSFLPLQSRAMASAMSDRDSVVVLPTGGGKSLCFQAPAVCREGLALVVSPLISLMKDQVDALRACGVPAAAINSTLAAGERRQVAEQIRRDELKLVYVAPERLLMDRTLEFFKQTPLSLIAIDEAHCISQWGHDFRPEYRGLRILKDAFPGVGVHAYTATATEAVQRDIADQLGLVDPQFLVGSFDRPNLVFRVRRPANRFAEVCRLVEQRRGDAGIVYCISRKEVDKTAGALAALGYRAVPYHAGLSDDQRHRHQDAFLEERADVVVATVAFGMGIDKSNVRYVIHAGMPKSLEHYVQESGRAGRDGLEADCLLLFSGRDGMVWRSLVEKGDQAAAAGALESLAAMEQFCGSVVCRHRALVEHFGQTLEAENCGACDVCLGELDLVADPVILAQKILSCVVRLEQRFGADYTAKVLAGSGEQRIKEQGHDRLSTYGLLGDEPVAAIRQWIEQLASQGFLVRTGEYNVLELTESGRQLLKGDGAPQLLKPAKQTAKRAGSSPTPADSWEGVDRALFDRLRILRTELAATQGVPPYVVFGDAALRDMARRRPSSLAAFLDVRGVGQRKCDDYGSTFVEAIVEHCTANNVPMDAAAPTNPSTPAQASEEGGGELNPSHIAAFAHFRCGAPIEEVMQEMNRARSTVAGYLHAYIRHEQVLDPAPWVEPELAQRIEAALETLGPGPLKPLYEHFGGEISYDDLRLVAACVANRG
jgi:ATP-dependent DNA helicase RecQ